MRWRGQLSHIALGCPDVERSADFYADILGLTRHPCAVEGQLRLGWGIGQHALDLVPGKPALDHYAIEVPDERELKELVRHARACGAAVEERPGDEGQPDSYAMFDPEGRRVEFHGRVNRAGEHTADPGRRPVRIQHITLAATDLACVVDFYVETLGFTISDRMGDVFTWLRCGSEHHTVAVVRSDAPSKLDHYSFDLDAWQDFKVWADRLSEQGYEIAWGPGRHGPGNNLFIMFQDAAGHLVELSSEMEHYFDDLAEYPPRAWTPSTRTVNLWGSAPAWRTPNRSAETEPATA
jgi:catechol 2,3-dioxygenase-like lactoylglutathione lyase family enzyme